jgi:hypothetical protein
MTFDRSFWQDLNADLQDPETARQFEENAQAIQAFDAAVNAATAQRVQHLQAQITGLEEDRRANPPIPAGQYNLVAALGTIAALCNLCPDDDHAAQADNAQGLIDARAFIDQIHSHHRRHHPDTT